MLKKILIYLLVTILFNINCVFALYEDFDYIQNNTDNTVNLYKNNVDSIVYIETQDSSGSGVIVKSDGTFITCFHVIANADYITVKLNDGSIYNVDGFRYINPLDDIAILTLDTTRKFKPILLNQNNNIEIGAKVYTISNPQGIQFTFSDGIISQYAKDYIQFTAPVSPGSSGGALLNTNGQLIGMITSLLQESQNINFALPNKYYQSKINNQVIKNTKKLNWTNFLVDNAETNQFHLYTNYALNELNFEMLYKYIRPFSKREDYPKEHYAMTGLFAFYAACVGQNDNYLKEAIDWFKLSYKYYPNDELTLFTLPLLMAFNGNQESDFSIQILYKLKNTYPNSYDKFVSFDNLASNCKDEKCAIELMFDMLDYIILLSNLKKY